MVDHFYDDQKDIISLEIHGSIDNSEILHYLKTIGETYAHKSHLYIISDYSDGFIKPNPSFYLVNINKVREYFIQYFKNYDQFYNAYVLNPSDSSTRFLIDQFLKMVSDIDNFHASFFENNTEAEAWIRKMQSKKRAS